MVEADSINIFKIRLDKYWTNQDVIYDYDCDLTGSGGLVGYHSVCNILSFEMQAKRIYLRPSYHIGLDWIVPYISDESSENYAKANLVSHQVRLLRTRSG